MLDIKYIRTHRDILKQTVADKSLTLDIDDLLSLDKERVCALQEVETLKSLKNDINALIANTRDDAERQEIIAKGKDIKNKLEVKEPMLKDLEKRFHALMVLVPTVPSDDTPRGASEKDNVVVYERGTKTEFSFAPKTHVEIAESLDLIDFKQGAVVSGYRGYYLKNEGMEIALALMMYAVSKMISKGFTPMIPPTLVKEFALYGTGYFKGGSYDSEVDEIYQVATSNKEADGKTSKEKKFLVGTAEPGLLAYYAGQTLDAEALPQKLCGYSQCYRSEIGSYGKDVKGLYRVHEFMKVEQVVIAPADDALADTLQEEMVAMSEEIHHELGLPYRKLAICTGDMGAGKYRQFDLEAWMPGLARWGETGSASHFKDWQSRRLRVKYKDADGEKKYVYMLNNTVLPSVRPLIAILENYQQVDGSVIIPEVLHKFMPSGKKVIVPRA